MVILHGMKSLRVFWGSVLITTCFSWSLRKLGVPGLSYVIETTNRLCGVFLCPKWVIFVDTVTLVTLMPWTSMRETQGYCPLVAFFLALQWQLPFVPKKNKNKKLFGGFFLVSSSAWFARCNSSSLSLNILYDMFSWVWDSDSVFLNWNFIKNEIFKYFEFFWKKSDFGGFSCQRWGKEKE